ncbi:acyltransferase family protein [Flocculibacter collagenilyticus]|uniref:acyltransferase family protein n=1 Tax=Flocculibacter collagenilyticus TaxID=2744479 RepID=UPI0018F5489A|nr:acyltransferase [Flocculibacter collagenilyticus]
MNKQLSVYLDLLRFFAAVIVFVSHLSGFMGGLLWQLSGIGHEAVVFFFVLSGFVIAYVVYEKQETATSYTVNRLSRIYSVALPAIILTVILYYLGSAIDPTNEFKILEERLLNPVWTVIAASTFINQSWIATPLFSNLPYWSLGYEVLYYIFFGILVYVAGVKKYLLLAAICLVMGPSVMLYLPVWLMGVLCFKTVGRVSLSLLAASLLYAISVIGIIVVALDVNEHAINQYAMHVIGVEFYQILLEPAEHFISDYILGIFVTLHIFASYHLGKYLAVFGKRSEAIIRNISSHTFSIYLYHMPLLYFAFAVFPPASHQIENTIACCLVVPVCIYLLSCYTENKKWAYKNFFKTYLIRKEAKTNDEASTLARRKA